MLSDALAEVELTGDLHSLRALPGNDLMLAVPVTGGDGSFRRRYTIRRSTESSVTLWIDVTAAGPGATWAHSAPLGSTIEAIGPRGQVTLDPLADWHLFIGDLSFLSAAYAMAEAIEPPGQALFVLQVDDEAHLVTPILDDAVGVTLCVIERTGWGPSDPVGLLAGLGALELPEDEGVAYVGGELSVVAAVRSALLERGFSAEAIRSKPYWRLGVSNLAHGEPKKDDLV
jgi:NADPH-dependent ferric siderophore reductase